MELRRWMADAAVWLVCRGGAEPGEGSVAELGEFRGCGGLAEKTDEFAFGGFHAVGVGER